MLEQRECDLQCAPATVALDAHNTRTLRVHVLIQYMHSTRTHDAQTLLHNYTLETVAQTATSWRLLEANRKCEFSILVDIDYRDISADFDDVPV